MKAAHNKTTARKGSAALAAPAAAPAPAAGRKGRMHVANVSAGDLMSRLGKWRDALNPLRGLTPQRLTQMIEDAKRGAQSDLQWLLEWIEEEDAVYGAIVERSLSALSGLDHNILIAQHVPEDHRELAERQRQCLETFYHNLKGLRECIEGLGMARFRGCAFLEVWQEGGQLRLEPVPPEYFVRDGSRGGWAYSENASSGAVTGQPLEPGRWIIRESARPVGRKAARLFVIKSLSLKDWQGFAEVFGIPAIFALMPEGITPEQRDEFQQLAERIVSEARGALPAGSDIKTVSAGSGQGSPFSELMDWCDAQMVIAGTGGLLTMLSAPGSGTLAGGAHQEAFDLIARREAVLVSEILNDQLDARILGAAFPGLPQYAYFSLAAAEENDPDKVVDHAVKLRAAGWKMSAGQLNEKTGYELAEEAPPGAGAAVPAAPVVNSQPEAAPAVPPGVVLNADPDQTPEPEPPPAVAPPPAEAVPEARKALAEALDEDFGGVRSQLEKLAGLDPDSAEFQAAAAEAARMVELLSDAAPGSLAADRIFESLAAEGLLDGWGVEEGGRIIPA